MHENDEQCRVEKPTTEPGACPVPVVGEGDQAPNRLDKSQPEGIWITKFSRGEPRTTFVTEIIGLRLARSVFPPSL
jgi:hypothetical protein